MQVLAFIDDCGHTRIVDVSTPEQALKVYMQMLAEAAGDGNVQEDLAIEADALVKAAQGLLASGKEEDYEELADEIWDFCFAEDNVDIQLGFRDGIGPFEPEKEWPRNCY